MGRTQGGSTPRYICRGCAGYADQSGYRIRYRSGCTQASRLIEGIDADHLIADTPKTPNPSSPPFKSDASPFGLVSRDYAIRFRVATVNLEAIAKKWVTFSTFIV